jgi:UDP-N-acetylmuramoyl-tripeptide--D-alanyl-D-alanine ligase
MNSAEINSPENPLWRMRELEQIFNQPFPCDIHGVCIDSRAAVAGDLFIALSSDPGPRFNGGKPISASASARDGHDFVSAAINSGALGVMSHKELSVDVPVLQVDDTLDGLWQLGKAARTRFTGPVLAITGSSGKTTIRSWIESVLRHVAGCHASVGSLNNHWGVPLSLSRMPRDAQFGIFEIGMNHPGEIAPLAKLVSPDVAMVLNVLPAHIGNFPNMAALREEKLSIAEGLNDNGTLILPASLRDLAKRDRVVTFSAIGDDSAGSAAGKSADVSAKAQATANGTSLEIDCLGEYLSCEVPFMGKERIESVLAMVAALKCLNVDLTKIPEALAQLQLPSGRGNQQHIRNVLIIDDSYNANPASMAMSLQHLVSLPVRGRRIALLGEMLELGQQSKTSHEQAAKLCDAVDEVITIGAGFSGVTFKANHRHYRDPGELDIADFASDLNQGDALLVKGSNAVFWVNNFVSRLKAQLNL